jgi:hypothetical protein
MPDSWAINNCALCKRRSCFTRYDQVRGCTLCFTRYDQVRACPLCFTRYDQDEPVPYVSQGMIKTSLSLMFHKVWSGPSLSLMFHKVWSGPSLSYMFHKVWSGPSLSLIQNCRIRFRQELLLSRRSRRLMTKGKATASLQITGRRQWAIIK